MFGLDSRNLNILQLPSQGLFYRNDFEITINKANEDEIKEYEDNYIKDDISIIIYYIKKIVESNITLSKSYKYEDIKSIDIIFIFIEIVKLTRGKPINFIFYNRDKDIDDKIEFGSQYFNYYDMLPLMDYYDHIEKCFVISGYKYTLPSVGVENSLTNFLIRKSDENEFDDKLFYDFTHFLSNKNNLKFREIENLIEIFNNDLSEKELDIIKDILRIFSPIQRYSLKKGSQVIEMSSKINLEKIWK